MQDDGSKPVTARRLFWQVEHVIAILVAIVAAIVVFLFTGESEFFLALGSGMGLGGIAWVASYLHLNSRRPSA